ncbi:MAG: translation initiation factor IF-2 [Bdellovibrionales bacterium]|nr:translation initiation factor IF-2 [Bdellovibrionales bacterium]
MAKLRVYELAKELGVENKVVIEKAIELGIAGVRSHSNSLDPGDADSIRRAMLRAAVGTEKQDTEVIRKTVDKDTGETSTVVEKRSGNVIRRRKRDAASEVEAAPPTSHSLAADEEPSGIGHADFSETIDQQDESDEESGDSLLEDSPGDSIAVAAVEEEVANDEIVEAAQVVETVVQVPEVQASVLPYSDHEDTRKEQGEDEKKGPKVLGKIELAREAEKKPAAAAKKKFTGRKPAQAEEEEEGEDDSPRRDGTRGRAADSARRKSRKREFSRTDLVDYEGLSPRKSGKTSKSKKQSESLEEGERSTEITTPKASKRVIKMSELITVGDLAQQMSLKAGEVIKKLIELGVMATINQVVDQDTATIVAEEFGFLVESTSFDETEILDGEEQDTEESLQPRPPVVTVMGHVDHGKTSLLDTIRKSSVAVREHGGITQHIGAYQVVLPDDRRITFIDTPGHAAFTEMRARGAKVTDVVILVVAADDGVMPQTVEAIEHAKAAGVPILVAVNKMDRPNANPDRVKQQLSDRGLQPEEWGGDTLYFPVSALQGQGISELLEGILLVSELQELKANPDRRAHGRIIEARQERGRGIVATVLIQRGTLRLGDIYVTGAEFGRVRSMSDENGDPIEIAGPSAPVEITGLTGVPSSGDDFVVVESEVKARSVAEHRAELQRSRDALSLAGGPISLEEFSKQAGKKKAAELNLIIKADVHGSLEAVRDSVVKLSGDKVKVQVVLGGVGAVNENDVQLAIASKALIIGFNVRAEARASQEAERSGVEVRFYRIIYELIDDVKMAMAGLLEPIRREKPIGKIEVRDTFSVPKIGKVAGGYVSEGLAKRGSRVRLLRDSAVIFEGKMSGLRRFKDDVKEVQSGYECGVSIENYNDIKIGDVIEMFEVEEIQASVDDLNL